MVITNMQEIWHKDARKPSYDSMCRGKFMGTYSALWAMERLPFDRYSSTRYRGRELRLSFGLNLPPMWFLISHFFKVFCKVVWPFLQSSVRPFDL